jgi:hypothetical protein
MPNETTDPIVHEWLRQAEDQRRFAELATSEQAKLEHIAAAKLLSHMASMRTKRLREDQHGQ